MAVITTGLYLGIDARKSDCCMQVTKAQMSDQRFYCPFSGKYDSQACYMERLNILA